MLNKNLLLIIIVSLILFSCAGYLKIPNDENGEPILNEKVNYTFTSIPNSEAMVKVDTCAYYVQIFEGRYYNKTEKENPKVLIFHNDGFFKKTSVKNFSELEEQNKNSVNYGGKFQIKEKVIELEEFSPSKGGETKFYTRNIRRGLIERNKIIFDDGQYLLTIYEKRYELE